MYQRAWNFWVPAPRSNAKCVAARPGHEILVCHCTTLRHCERSEAIQKSLRGKILDCFATLAMTEAMDDASLAFATV
ncbi:hypothetical protein ACVWYQ_003793 [Bradyrhizobium sp. USDA 3397]